MIEPIKGKRGEELALCKCTDCAAEETVAAPHGGGHGGSGGRRNIKMAIKNEGQVTQKLTKSGWALVKGKLRCPRCEVKRKESNVTQTKQAEAPREPTRPQKRQIMDMLEAVYDVDAERYTGGDTDDTVASTLNVMPGWVAGIREEFFGPDGGNDDMEEYRGQLEAFLSGANEKIQSAEKEVSALMELRRSAQGHLQKLNAIKKAVGPRIMKKAGG